MAKSGKTVRIEHWILSDDTTTMKIVVRNSNGTFDGATNYVFKNSK